MTLRTRPSVRPRAGPAAAAFAAAVVAAAALLARSQPAPAPALATAAPQEIDAPLVNPGTGWGLWAGPRFFDGRPFSVETNTKGFGDWGEWHTMWSHYPWPSRERKREVLAKIIRFYADVFAPGRPPGTPLRELCIAQVYDDDCGGDTPVAEAMKRQALDIATGLGFSFSRHGFIDGLGGWPDALIARHWKTHPMVAEANWSYEQVKKDGTHGTMAEFVDAFIRHHSIRAHMYTHADSYKQAMAGDRGEHERALRKGGIGYRFVLTSASWESTRQPGQALTLRQRWVNRNSGWCVQPFRLKLVLVDSAGQVAWTGSDESFDPRAWISGAEYAIESTFDLPGTLKPGAYDLRIALVDAAGVPRVRLAVADGDESLRYRLGFLRIVRAE